MTRGEFGGVDNAKSISAPIRPIGASGAPTEGRPVENLDGEYASRQHESHGWNPVCPYTSVTYVYVFPSDECPSGGEC